jgi:cell division protein FtsI (penicillin-binding protein 3)
MDEKIFKRRVITTGFIVMIIACFFIFRAAELHFSGNIKVSEKKTYESRRGYIKDRNGNILAVSIEKNSLYINPGEIQDPQKFAQILSPAIGLSEKHILSRIKPGKRFVWLKRKLEDEEFVKINNLYLRGVHFTKEYARVYPYDRLVGNILGFVNVDNIGIEGIEYKFNDILLEEENKSIFSLGKNGVQDSDLTRSADITLTIDKYIQYVSEKEIKEAVVSSRAIQGSAVVLEVKTGKILAAAKYPDFDPNYYFKFPSEARSNYAISNAFEPGSTLKIMALAAILEKNPKAIQREYVCDGNIVIGDTTIKCTKVHGRLNIADIIKYSCNVGIIQAMKNVSKDDYYSILSKFGFGEKTGVEVPGEAAGILRPVKDWSGLSKYSISIGQEISVTTVQLAAAFSAIANGGVYLSPTIIEKIEKGDSTPEYKYEIRPKSRIVSAENAKIILRMMREVVKGGTGELAGIEYYEAAGKTGTAQKFFKREGYAEKYIASFIGLLPFNDPDICILVILDEPKTTISGGEVAAPAFARIAKKVLVYRGERIKKTEANDPYSGKIRDVKFDGITMPDFRGLFMSESINLLIKMQNRNNIKYNFTGKGRVFKQSPAAGTKLNPGQQIIIYLTEINPKKPNPTDFNPSEQ